MTGYLGERALKRAGRPLWIANLKFIGNLRSEICHSERSEDKG
jgi:hypothetical protein